VPVEATAYSIRHGRPRISGPLIQYCTLGVREETKKSPKGEPVGAELPPAQYIAGGRKKKGSIIAGMLTDTPHIMHIRCPQDEYISVMVT
jgi:hypothetical protein